MKSKKYVAVLLALIICSGSPFAQEYKVSVQNTKDGKLVLNDFYGELPIEGYAGNEIIISSTSDRFEQPPPQAKGLKPIYAAGTDNTGLALRVEKNGNQVTVQCLLPITSGGASYKIRVPENFSIQVKSECSRSNDVSIQNTKNEIEVNVCHSIKVKNVTGPLVLSNISGDINVVFSDINKDKPISIASVSGDIDVTVPAKTPVDLEMSTVSGNMYSDFELQADNKSLHRIGGNTINSKLNGGGTDIKIHNVSGNIYLRKG
jgi:hypothetical protein